MDLESVQKATSELLEMVGCARPPVPISRIAAAAGPLVVIDTDTPRRIDGGLFVEGDYALIVVNGRVTLNRQRWTIAHELGHLCRHSGRHSGQHSGCYLYSMHQFESEDEREAQRFAAELLMPAAWFLAAWHRTPKTDALARLFQVSKAAVCRRLCELDLAICPADEDDPTRDRGFRLGLPPPPQIAV